MKLQWQKSLSTNEHISSRFQTAVFLFFACVFSLALSTIISSIFYLNPLPFLLGLMLSASILIVLELISRKPAISMPLILLVLIVLSLLLVFHNESQNKLIEILEHFRDSTLVEANTAWYDSSPAAFTGRNRQNLYLLLVALSSLISFFIVRLFRQASVMLILLVISAAQAEFQQLSSLVIPVSAALFSALFVLSQSTKAFQTKLRLPIARVTLLLVFSLALNSLLAPDVFYNAKLDRFLKQAEQEISQKKKTSGFYDFSLNSAGYYPETSDLGGPVTLSDSPFAEVQGDSQAFYLRGAVYGTYTGKSWQKESMEEGILFDDNTVADVRYKTFLINPPELYSESLLRDGSYRLKPLIQPQQSILIAGQPNTVNVIGEGIPLALYFNRSGSVYADNNLPDEGYEVRGPILNIGQGNYEAAVNQILLNQPQVFEINMNEAERSHWLSLPEAVSANLLQEFMQETDILHANAALDQELAYALQIKERLSSSLFTYDLDVPNLPEDREFVDWFLESKSGYCTYFATALTVLCRQAGIPARYVEGYVVPSVNADPNGVYKRIISGKQAHAWTEIYLESIGWLALDATPAGYQDQLTTTVLDESIQEHTVSSTSNNTTETTQSEENDTSTSSRDQESVQSSSSKTENAETEMSKPKIHLEDLLPFVLILLLALLAVAYYLWRLEVYRRRHDLAWQLQRQDGDINQTVLAIWEDMRHLAKLNAYIQCPEQSIAQYIDSWPETFKAEQSRFIIEQTIYGNKPASMDEIAEIMQTYQSMEELTKKKLNRAEWLLKRFLFS